MTWSVALGKLINIKYYGGCHCGAVRFEVYAPAQLVVIECNCSICYASGFLHLHIKNEDFTLLCGEALLNIYRFNTMQARHTFCKICGIKPFYRPRSHPNDYSINVKCLEIPTTTIIVTVPFDGKHWEQNIEQFPEQPVGEPTTHEK